MSMLVVMAIAILVLIIVAMFFSGGFKRLGLSMVTTSESMAESGVAEAQLQCNQRCAQVLLQNSSLTCKCSKCGNGFCDADLGEDTFTCADDNC